MKFALIGDGAIAKYHKEAIKHIGGELLEQNIIDPKYAPTEYLKKNPGNLLFSRIEGYATLKDFLFEKDKQLLWQEMIPRFDYVVICSPSYMHYQQIKAILKFNQAPKIICEKPAFLPWEPIIDDNRINIILQLRYLSNLPKKADFVSVRFVRDEAYFKSWKGDPKKTGGLFYNLFIHYIDLADRLGADFEGIVVKDGKQEKYIGTRWSIEIYPTINYKYIKDIDKIDLLNIDMQSCYNRLYEDILNGKGIKPSNIFYLNWILQRNSEIFGYGKNGLGKAIIIKNELI